mmetsp:Transcript_57182/g.149778  ORF Transcript_57182/g.149778 Transcript_57182/m.149778 type:complete len:124 (-) Transcript_57182:34-405(-)
MPWPSPPSWRATPRSPRCTTLAWPPSPRRHWRTSTTATACTAACSGSTSWAARQPAIQRPWSLCENLGATESIITACAVMTHANMLKEDRLKVGITDGFIRISVGIEEVEDLIRALSEALKRC